jgi:hypothetical protein
MSPAVYAPVWQPVTFRGQYRHMAKRDAAVWEQFLRLYADRFAAFAYDVALGGIALTMPEMTDEESKGWQYSTALKIDVVAREADRYWIIEVRPDVNVSALGAALTYTMLCARDQVFDGPLVPTIVCDFIQPDVQWACAQLGIQVFAVPNV